MHESFSYFHFSPSLSLARLLHFRSIFFFSSFRFSVRSTVFLSFSLFRCFLVFIDILLLCACNLLFFVDFCAFPAYYFSCPSLFTLSCFKYLMHIIFWCFFLFFFFRFSIFGAVVVLLSLLCFDLFWLCLFLLYFGWRVQFFLNFENNFSTFFPFYRFA